MCTKCGTTSSCNNGCTKPTVREKPILPMLQGMPYFPQDSYRRYLPSAYDNSMSIYEQLTQVIAYLNHMGELTNDLICKWNEINEWIMNEGLQDAVDKQLEEWVKDGTLETIINDKLFSWLSDNKASINQEYKKKVFASLPLRFPHWQEISNKYGGVRLYPQSFTIDWVAKEIHVINSPTNTTLTTKRFVSVFDLKGVYKTCYQVGNAGGEGIVIKYSQCDRYVYVKTKNHYIGKHAVPVDVAPMTEIAPLEEYPCDVDWQFSERNGKWLLSQDGADVGTYKRKTSFLYTDSTFNPIGSVFTDIEDGGYFNSPYETRFSKRQGVALGNGSIYFGMGGYVELSATSPYGYYGIKKLNNNGDLINDSLIDAKFLGDTLISKGYTVTRIENEGVHCSPSGGLYSICVTLAPTDDASNCEGIIIFEENSPSKDAIDFGEGAVTWQTINTKKINSGMFPRYLEGKYRNPLTGEVFDTVTKMVEFMHDTNLSFFRFYSSSQNVTNLYDGGTNPIESGRLVEIMNPNNSSAIIMYHGNASVRDYKTAFYKKNNVWVEEPIYDNRWISLTLESGLTPTYPSAPIRLIVSNYIKMFEGSLQGVLDKPLPLLITKLPERARPFFNKHAVIPLSASENGGYGTIQIRPNGDVMLMYVSRNTNNISLDSVVYY